jgi:hypothetical protein
MADGGDVDAGDHREGARQRCRGCEHGANHHPDNQEPICAKHQHGEPSWTCDGPRKHEARHQAGGGGPRAEALAVLNLLGDGGGNSGAESESSNGDCAAARAGGQDHWGADQVRPCDGDCGRERGACGEAASGASSWVRSGTSGSARVGVRDERAKLRRQHRHRQCWSRRRGAASQG